MSFYKHFPNRKDWRKPYQHTAAAFDSSCRPNGSCSYCRSNRKHSEIKRKMRAQASLKRFLNNED